MPQVNGGGTRTHVKFGGERSSSVTVDIGLSLFITCTRYVFMFSERLKSCVFEQFQSCALASVYMVGARYSERHRFATA